MNSAVVYMPARSGRAIWPWVVAAAAGLALALLAATMAWHVPMMLWDHLDLLPIYEAWRAGALRDSELLRIHHGSHLHVTAYGLLLLTTVLSGGQPWLDCVLSWTLLLCYAGVVLAFARTSLPARTGMRWWLGIILFALFPGHLSNLQWGWQVAVFVSLVGSALCLCLVGSRELSWPRNLLALVAAVCAIFSFSVGFALAPVAVALICLRRDLTIGTRVTMSLPWLMLALVLVYLFRGGMTGGEAQLRDAALIAAYVLNFLGSGVARYATSLAPWVAAMALVSVVHLGWRLRSERAALMWIGLILFALTAAGLVAIGRAAVFGAEQAFVARYVSFSSTFWLGWLGLLAVGLGVGVVRRRGAHCWLAGLVMGLALFNVLHLTKQARDTALRASATAGAIRDTWPEVGEAVLREIYFDRADTAKERLHMLHARGFAPFDASRNLDEDVEL